MYIHTYTYIYIYTYIYTYMHTFFLKQSLDSSTFFFFNINAQCPLCSTLEQLVQTQSERRSTISSRQLLFVQWLFVLRLTFSANLVHASVFVAIEGTGRQGSSTTSLAKSFCPAVVAHINIVLLGHTVRHLCALLLTFRTSREQAFTASLMQTSICVTTKRRRRQTSQAFCALPLA